jgi:tRNA A37 methylthiotransferase MiaB
VEFDHLGTYRYSPETGTPAADLPDRVPEEEILDREALILDLQGEISLRRQLRRLGGTWEIVVDAIGTPGPDDPLGVDQLLTSLLEGQWLESAGPESLQRVVKGREAVAVGRSHHYGYDLDGVVVLPAENLRPGYRLKVDFKAVTAFDTWAEVV